VWFAEQAAKKAVGKKAGKRKGKGGKAGTVEEGAIKYLLRMKAAIATLKKSNPGKPGNLDFLEAHKGSKVSRRVKMSQRVEVSRWSQRMTRRSQRVVVLRRVKMSRMMAHRVEVSSSVEMLRLTATMGERRRTGMAAARREMRERESALEAKARGSMRKRSRKRIRKRKRNKHGRHLCAKGLLPWHLRWQGHRRHRNR
jgi:hypothetical protein